MSNTIVLGMAQDQKGIMWFSCRSGITSYDGATWKKYGSAEGLEGSSYRWIRVDDWGTIWAATRYSSRAIAQFDGTRWKTEPSMPDQYLPASSFLFEVGRSENHPMLVLAQEEGGLHIHNGKGWNSFTSKNGLPDDEINGLLVFRDQVMVATGAGLTLVEGDRVDNSLTQWIPAEYRSVQGLAAMSSEEPLDSVGLWLLGYDWIGTLQDRKFRLLASWQAVDRFSIPTLKPDKRGGIYYGSERALYHFQLGESKPRRLTTSNGWAVDAVNDMLVDREGIFWLTSMRGVAKIPSMNFANYSQSEGLLEDEVTAVIEWRPGEILFGHNTGMTFFREDKFQKIHLIQEGQDFDSPARVMDLARSPSGDIWVAASMYGLLRLSPDLEKHIYQPFPEGTSIVSVFTDIQNGNLWVCAPDKIAIGRDNHFDIIDCPLPKTDFRKIIKTRDGTVYVATTNAGLYSYANGAWRAYKGEELAHNNTSTVLEDSQGRLWVGSLAGLLRLQNDRLVPAHFGGPTQNRPVFLIFQDSQSRLWIGGDNGVFRRDKRGNSRHFTIRDGLSGLETNRGAGLVDSQANVWVGTDSGISRYQEEFGNSVIPPPLVSLETVVVGKKSYSLDKPLDLAHLDNDLIFHFKATSFLNEDHIQLQTWLKGHDDDWATVSTGGVWRHRYTNLSPGNYQFNLRAGNSLGIWSDPIVSEWIKIKQPLWLRPWFIALCLMLSLGLLYVTFDYLASKKNARGLELLVRERTAKLEVEIEEHRVAEERYQALSEVLEERVKERTTELELVQKDLIEKAHSAGMAEIATSMLHNVGNILNSVSTSGYLVLQSLERLPVARLGHANKLLMENMDNLEHFFQEDQKGCKLPHYYLSLGQKFSDHKEDLHQHTLLLMEKINTIRDVVAQQHNYASGVFQMEEVALEMMVETAITILEGSLVGKGIILERTYQKVPMVKVQKTKLVHTLVNLLKNARESILIAGAEKKIRISILPLGERVCLRITDSGMGISEANLLSIFSHGFTTKKGGHGFGLHSCANAMTEMGGTIWAESEGPGQGATFVLSFPPCSMNVLSAVGAPSELGD